MKKISFYMTAGLLAFILYFIPLSADAKEQGLAVSKAPIAAQELTAPQNTAADITLTYVPLEEKEKWILDEVLSDYVSEDVVELMDSGRDYSIGSWVDRGTFTYLFFDKELAAGTLYTVSGYALSPDGHYVYFELSSPEKLSEQLVDLEITKAFGNGSASVPKAA